MTTTIAGLPPAPPSGVGPWWWESDPDRPARGHDWRYVRDRVAWVCWCGASQPVAHYYDDPDAAGSMHTGHASGGWLVRHTVWRPPAGWGWLIPTARPRPPLRRERARWTATPEVAAQVARIIDGLAERKP